LGDGVGVVSLPLTQRYPSLASEESSGGVVIYVLIAIRLLFSCLYRRLSQFLVFFARKFLMPYVLWDADQQPIDTGALLDQQLINS
jgi:hypothetical protein